MRRKPRYHLGRSREAVGDLDAALAAFRGASRLRPDLAQVATRSGLAEFEARLWEGAKFSLERALELDPSSEPALVGRVTRW